MKTPQARKLIGKEVEWLDAYDPYRGGLVRRAIIREVQGRNILMDEHGTMDWRWLPSLVDLKEVKP